MIDDDFVPDLRLGGQETQTFRDFVLIDAEVAPNVAAVNAMVSIRDSFPDTSVAATPTPQLTSPPTPTSAPTMEAPVLSTPAPSQTSESSTPLDDADYAIYALQPGDSLLSIANRFGVSIEQLMAANHLTNPDLVVSGQRILIPPSTAFLPSVPPDQLPADDAQVSSQRAVDASTPVPTSPSFDVKIAGITSAGALSSEAVQIANYSSLVINLDGWRIESEHGAVYTFGALSLFPGSGVVLFSGSGTDTSVALYWNQPQAVWQSGETARLYNSEGDLLSQFQVP